MKLKKMKILSLALSAALLLTSCGTGTSKSASSSTESNVTATAQKSSKPEKETIMVYMVASDLESDGAMASRDIAEMVKSKFDKENLDVLICTGGTEKWWIDDIPTDKTEVYKIQDDDIEQVYTMKGKNMAEPETLTEFLDYGYDNYKSDAYGLVLWNHGGGAVLGYGADQNYDYDTLSISELESSFSKSKLCKEDKFEWIGFDACLMGMVEVANMLEPYSNYMVASEEVETAEGWDYSFLSDVSKNKKFTGDECGKAIVDTYSEYCKNDAEFKPDYTLSCLNLSETKNVIKSLEGFVDVAEKELKDGKYSDIARLRGKTKAFGKISNYSFYDTVDIYNLAEEMKGLYSKESTELMDSIKNMTVYNKSNVSNANGLAIYFPYENKEYAEEWLKEYGTIKFSQTYSDFINTFTDTLSGDALTDWDMTDSLPIPLPEEEEPKPEDKKLTYFVQLTPAEMKNFDKAAFQIWQEDSPGNYISYITSSDVTLSEDGKLRSAFDGMKFYIGDTSGNSTMCSAIEMERTEDCAKYVIPITISRTTNFDIEIAYIHIRVDKENPNGVILGVYKDMDTEDSLLPSRKPVKIQDGNEIRPYFFARKIGFNEDGSVQPYESWGKGSGAGAMFTFSGKLTIDSKVPEQDKQYIALFNIKDTQGNKYYSNPIYINK